METSANNSTVETAATSSTTAAANSQNNGAAQNAEAVLNSKSEIKFRETVYRMIISQLFYDGYQHPAVGLSAAIQVEKAPLIGQ